MRFDRPEAPRGRCVGRLSSLTAGSRKGADRASFPPQKPFLFVFSANANVLVFCRTDFTASVTVCIFFLLTVFFILFVSLISFTCIMILHVRLSWLLFKFRCSLTAALSYFNLAQDKYPIPEGEVGFKVHFEMTVKSRKLPESSLPPLPPPSS